MRSLCLGIDIPHPDPELLGDCYITEYTFRGKNCYDLLDETIFIIFSELTRFKKTLEECESDLDKMCYIIKHGGGLTTQPSQLRSQKYDRVFEACEIAAFSKEKRTQYENDMMEERELNSKLETAEAKGISKAKLTINMLKDGIAIDQICRYTGLTEAQVAELQALL